MDNSSTAISNERLSALFDGVIAIVLTLLVLELKLPDIAGNGDQLQLAEGLEGQLPDIIAWLISFVMIARIWQEQHSVWAGVSKCDGRSIFLTFVLMASCSLIPFSSDLIGDYPLVPLVVAVFSVTMAFSGLIVAALAAYSIHSPHLHRQGSQVMRLRARTHYLLIAFPSVAVFAVFFAYIHHPLIGISAWLLEPVAAFLFRQRTSPRSG